MTPSQLQTLGVNAVSCGDAGLLTFLTPLASIVWTTQNRRGVVLDLQYQYFTLDLIELAQNHVRMLIDSETGDAQMAATGYNNSSNVSDSSSSFTRTRSSSFSSSASSQVSFARSASRTSSSAMTQAAQSSSSRTSSGFDHSATSQSSSGSSSRDFHSHTTVTGRGGGGSSVTRTQVHSSVYEGHGGIDEGGSFGPFPNGTMTHGSISGLVGGNGVPGLGLGFGYNAYHGVGAPLVIPGDTNKGGGSTGHTRGTLGFSSTNGASTFSASGTQTRNAVRTSHSVSSGSSSFNSSSSMSSTSHDEHHRTANSTSHAQMTGSSHMVASSLAHRESAGANQMTSTSALDREYFSQIFESLKQMWDDTKQQIERLEQQVLIAMRYQSQKIKTLVNPLMNPYCIQPFTQPFCFDPYMVH